MDSKLTNRYVVSGVLEMQSGLHVGGGLETLATDSAVMREASGKPFIPGSSLKGVMRSRVERIVPLLSATSGVWSCQLFETGAEGQRCLSSISNQKKIVQLREEVALKKTVGESKVLTEEYKAANPNVVISDQFIYERYLPENLCDTCKVFGSPVLASKVRVRDLRVREPFFDISEIRDGVGIDRDTETAVDQVKFDFEVIPSQTEFDLQITLESVTERELAVFAVGLREFVEGNAPIGGLTSRGLGVCKVKIETIRFVDFTQPAHLQEYLVAGKMAGLLSQDNLFDKIRTELLAKKAGGDNAEAAA